jgi:hypothetical protein
MVLPKKARAYRRRPPTELKRKGLYSDRIQRSRSRAKGLRIGDDLVEAFEEMAKHRAAKSSWRRMSCRAL